MVNDVRQLIEALGGPTQVADHFEMTKQAVSNWIIANEIPPSRHAAMLQLAVQAGIGWRPPGWDPRVQLRWNPDREAA